jgi:hypothetical protein
MAPEFAPSIVVFDARLEGDSLLGSVEYVESPDPNRRLGVSWSVNSQPKDHRSVGGGVAYVNTKDGEIYVQSISKTPDQAP